MALTKYKHYSLGFFNMARGLGTLIVIFGHSMALYMVPPETQIQLTLFTGAGRVLGASVMAMFFLISGFYFHPRPVGKCIKTQARLLLKRYYLTAGAIILCRGVLQILRGKSAGSLVGMLTRTYLFGFNAYPATKIFGYDVGTVSLFWYILALFVGWVIYDVICVLTSGKTRWLLAGICVVCGWLLTEISQVWPMSLPTGLIAVGYIAVGAEIRNYRLLEQPMPVLHAIVVTVVALASLAFGYVDIAVCSWKMGLLDVAGTFCVGYLLLRLYTAVFSRRNPAVLARVIENVGLHSIWIFCIHGFEKALIPWEIIGKWFPGHPILCTMLCMSGRIFVIMVLFWLVYRARKRIRRRRRSNIVLEGLEEDCL